MVSKTVNVKAAVVGCRSEVTSSTGRVIGTPKTIIGNIDVKQGECKVEIK